MSKFSYDEPIDKLVKEIISNHHKHLGGNAVKAIVKTAAVGHVKSAGVGYVHATCLIVHTKVGFVSGRDPEFYGYLLWIGWRPATAVVATTVSPFVVIRPAADEEHYHRQPERDGKAKQEILPVHDVSPRMQLC